jgi:ribosomal protein S12 methylthiotransferase
MKKIINFSVINLGCTKNLVDLEYVLWWILSLESSKNQINFFPNPDDEEVEYLIINTCWFLSSSRAEAEWIMEDYNNIWKKLIIIGCYVPVKDDDFLASLENLEAVIPYEEIKQTHNILLWGSKIEKLKSWLGKLKNSQIKKYLSSIWGDQIWDKAFIYWTESVRAFLAADKWYEYLKIAEWCNNKCSFCIIPNIRWKQRSRSIEDIIEEVKIMSKSWIKEIEIISQDTTRYWIDLYKWPKLIELLEEIDKVEWNFKIRLFYMYPDILSLSHIDRLSKLKKLIPYFDFPFQHISTKILKRMDRFYDDKHIFKILDYIKEKFENPFFHTNFIVWFPGEDEDDHIMMLKFAKKYEFDSVSVFGYHDEPLAKSSTLDLKVDSKTIKTRLNAIKEVLNPIYDKKDELRKGTVQTWFIEKISEEKGFCKIRPKIKAPDIDDLDKVKFEDLIEVEFINIWDIVEYNYL